MRRRGRGAAQEREGGELHLDLRGRDRGAHGAAQEGARRARHDRFRDEMIERKVFAALVSIEPPSPTPAPRARCACCPRSSSLMQIWRIKKAMRTLHAPRPCTIGLSMGHRGSPVRGVVRAAALRTAMSVAVRAMCTCPRSSWHLLPDQQHGEGRDRPHQGRVLDGRRARGGLPGEVVEAGAPPRGVRAPAAQQRLQVVGVDGVLDRRRRRRHALALRRRCEGAALPSRSVLSGHMAAASSARRWCWSGTA